MFRSSGQDIDPLLGLLLVPFMTYSASFDAVRVSARVCYTSDSRAQRVTPGPAAL